MKYHLAILGITILCYSCSSTNLMSLSVTEPAPVSLPPNARSAAVINRSRADDANKTIDAIHRVISVESKSLRADGAKASVDGLSNELMKTGRFATVRPLDNLDLRSYGAGVFPSSLSWDSVEKICRESNSDLLFSLELFDAESRVGISPGGVMTAITNVPTQVNMNTQVKTGWRIYDPYSRTILDEYVLSRDLSFQNRGLDPSSLFGRKEAVKDAASDAGQAYASRIVPYSIRVSRYYFVRGNSSFILAKRMARTGNWDGAAKLWQESTNSSSRKAAGRACYNMAISSEINGDLNGAIRWAQKAYEVYNVRLALSYVNLLRQRQSANEVLKSQTEVTSTP